MTQVPKVVKEERARRAAATAEEMHRAYLSGCVGETYPVLFEQPRDGKFSGHAPNYMAVLAEGENLHNEVRPVRITGVSGDVLLGEIGALSAREERTRLRRAQPETERYEKDHFFAYISRMRFIQRWALMRNTAPENVQEHSHQVAVLAHALAVIRNAPLRRAGGSRRRGAGGAVPRRQRDSHRRHAHPHQVR